MGLAKVEYWQTFWQMGGLTLRGADGMRWFVFKGARNRQGAEELIRYMLAQDVQRQIFKTSTGYAYPAYEWGWDEAIIADMFG